MMSVNCHTISIQRKLLTRILSLLLLSLAPGLANAQTLEDYIAEGLESNLVVQQRAVDFERAMMGLQEAKALFQPQLDFNATYVSGDGGRFFDIPIGDVLNPVYTALNFITQSELFPQIDNVRQNFFPRNQHDIKVRTSVPIYNSDLIHNRTIKNQQVELKAVELELYKRELVKQIKQGYYQYLMALESVSIYESARTLVERNLKINQSLQEAGKALPAQTLRARSELEQVNAQLTRAKKQAENAQAYFNFLLNKSLLEDINTDFDRDAALEESLQIDERQRAQREELRMLMLGRSSLETAYKMQQQFRLPKVGAFLDLGSQAEEFEFSRQSLYYFVGVQVDVPLYQRAQKFRKSQTQLDIKEMDFRMEEVKKQFDLSLNVARNDMSVARKNYESARSQQEAAAGYYRLIERGYKEGVHSLIELIDARNQLTMAEVQLNINAYQILIQDAELERETAAYPFK